jgi:hypothetical protein
MTTFIYKHEYFQVLIFNIVSITIVLLTPTISHIIMFPVYIFEPMRLIILSSIIYNNNKNKNAYFLAILLPLFSFVIAGHPSIYKLPLVSIDLLVNITIFNILIGKRLNLYLSLFLSILISKAIYYFLKSIFIHFGLLANGLIETNIIFQVINVLLVLIAAIICIRLKNK